jgi:hypothetical protein
MSIQSWKWSNIDSIFQFIIFSGNYSAASKLPGPPVSAIVAPFIGQVGSLSNPELYGKSGMPEKSVLLLNNITYDGFISKSTRPILMRFAAYERKFMVIAKYHDYKSIV